MNQIEMHLDFQVVRYKIPTGQQIQFKIGTSNLTGSTTFASSAFDVDGNYLNPSDYTGNIQVS